MSPLPSIPPIKVIIADDSAIARGSLRNMIADLPNVVFLGEACDGPEAIKLCLEMHPDLSLIDIRMPGMDGIAVTRVLSRDAPDIRVIMVTMLAQPALIVEALCAGARGYLLKDFSYHELVTALQHVTQGMIYMSREVDTEALRSQVLHISKRS